MSTSPISAPKLSTYRAQTFFLLPHLRVQTPADARRFVDTRGFVFFWPLKDITFPSLWAAVAGDRPVPKAHDDPGHITWAWKDQSLDKRWWYYGKILRGRATMISLADAPYFYALSENYGDPAHDYRQQYEDGLMGREAKQIYELLLQEGPLDTVNIRRRLHMTSKASNSPFERALVFLQRDFKILPVGVARTGAWRYSFIYECTHRWYPDLAAEARPITRRHARKHLLQRALRSLGLITLSDMRKLFQWRKPDTQEALAELVAEGVAVPLSGGEDNAAAVALPELLEG